MRVPQLGQVMTVEVTPVIGVIGRTGGESSDRALNPVDAALRGFDVSRVAIVGRDLRCVEQVTGRMTYGKAAVRGAMTGALVGVLIGWLFGIFDWFDPFNGDAEMSLGDGERVYWRCGNTRAFEHPCNESLDCVDEFFL